MTEPLRIPPDPPLSPIGGAPLSLDETLALMAPATGPRDPLPESASVVIIGAGPAGLTAAAILGAFGVECLLLDQKTTTSELPRAIAIDDEYMRLLATMGLGPQVAAHTSRPFGVHYISPFGFELAKVPGFITPNGFGNRNAVLQPVFEKILLAEVMRRDSVRIAFETTVASVEQDDAGVTLQVETAEGNRAIRAGYLLAADGARSFVRKTIGADFPGTRIDEPHLVVDFADFPDQSPFSRFFCNPRRPVNSILGPYGGRRMEFMLLEGDDHEAIQSDESIRHLVDTHTPYRGTQLNIIRRAVYGFSERIARPMQRGRIFLLGDAAHVMPPFGGQGMNSGARDAANIAWKLAQVVQGRLSPQILETYDTERRPHVEATVDISVRIGRLANIRSRPRSILRDAVFGLARIFPPTRRYLEEMRYMPKPVMRDGLVAHTDRDRDDGITGRLLPRCSFIASDAQRVLLDDLVGHRFALVGLAVAEHELAAAADHPLWHDLEPVVVSLPVGADQAADALLRAHGGKIVALRPDGFVAGAAPASEFATRISDRLATLLAPANANPRRNA